MHLLKDEIRMLHGLKCPYCGSNSRITSEKEVYGKIYNPKRVVYVCKKYPVCDAYVGSHDDGSALGRLSNEELRNYKKEAHYHFDKIWKEKLLYRKTAYNRMSKYMSHIPSDFCHIGMMNIDSCKQVIEWAKQEYKELKDE
jgi:hypothetical protein